MLGKLIKYDLKSMFRGLLPLCGVFIILGLLAGVSFPKEFTEDMPIGNAVIWGTVLVALIVMTVTVSILSMVIVIIRFYKNFLGDEGYLTFTLPVSVKAHLASKCISGYLACVISFVSGVVAYSGFAVFALLKTGNLAYMREAMVETIDELLHLSDRSGIYITLWLIFVIMESIKALVKIYFSMMLGHQSQDHRILMSFLAFVVITIAESMIRNLGSAIVFGVSIVAGSLGGMTTLGFMVCGIIINLVFGLLYLFGTYFLMKNRLNLA